MNTMINATLLPLGTKVTLNNPDVSAEELLGDAPPTPERIGYIVGYITHDRGAGAKVYLDSMRVQMEYLVELTVGGYVESTKYPKMWVECIPVHPNNLREGWDE